MADLSFYLITLVMYAVAVRRPGVAAGYVLGTFALEQSAQALVPLVARNHTLCNYLTAGTVVLAVGRRFAAGGLATFRLRAPLLLALTLIAYCYASYFWSLFPDTTFKFLKEQLPYLSLSVGLAPLLLASKQDLKDCLLSLAVCNFTALILLLLFADWGHRGVLLHASRMESNPLALAQAAGAMLITLAVSPLLRHKGALLSAAVTLAILAVVTVVFARTGSRGQVLGAIAVTVMFTASKRKAVWLPLAALGAIGLFASAVLMDEVLQNSERWQPSRMQGDMLESRAGQASRLLSLWSSSSPTQVVFGIGHGVSRSPRVLGGYPHMVAAEVLGEEGVVGAVLLLLALLASARNYARGIRLATGDDQAVLRTAAALFAYEFTLTWKQGTLLGATSFLLLLVAAGQSEKSKPARLTDQA